MIGKTDANTLRAGAPRIAPGWTLEKAEHTLSFLRISALDVHCKAHDVDNLYFDATFFPSSCAVNPALTIMANALRVGDHLLERLGARQPAFEGALA